MRKVINYTLIIQNEGAYQAGLEITLQRNVIYFSSWESSSLLFYLLLIKL